MLNFTSENMKKKIILRVSPWQNYLQREKLYGINFFRMSEYSRYSSPAWGLGMGMSEKKIHWSS